MFIQIGDRYINPQHITRVNSVLGGGKRGHGSFRLHFVDGDSIDLEGVDADAFVYWVSSRSNDIVAVFQNANPTEHMAVGAS